MSDRLEFLAYIATLVAIIALVAIAAALAVYDKNIEAVGVGAAVTGLIGVMRAPFARQGQP